MAEGEGAGGGDIWVKNCMSGSGFCEERVIMSSALSGEEDNEEDAEEGDGLSQTSISSKIVSES